MKKSGNLMGKQTCLEMRAKRGASQQGGRGHLPHDVAGPCGTHAASVSTPCLHGGRIRASHIEDHIHEVRERDVSRLLA